MQEDTWVTAHTRYTAEPTPDRPDGAIVVTADPERWKGLPVRTLDLTPRASQEGGGLAAWHVTADFAPEKRFRIDEIRREMVDAERGHELASLRKAQGMTQVSRLAVPSHADSSAPCSSL